jgi:hypothetical protein
MVDHNAMVLHDASYQRTISAIAHWSFQIMTAGERRIKLQQDVCNKEL